MGSRNDYDVLSYNNTKLGPNQFSPIYRQIQVHLHPKTQMKQIEQDHLSNTARKMIPMELRHLNSISPYIDQPNQTSSLLGAEYLRYPITTIGGKAARLIRAKIKLKTNEESEPPSISDKNTSHLFDVVMQKGLIEMNRVEYSLIKSYLHRPNWEQFQKVEVLMRRMVIFDYQVTDQDTELLCEALQDEIIKNLRSCYNPQDYDALVQLLC